MEGSKDSSPATREAESRPFRFIVTLADRVVFSCAAAVLLVTVIPIAMGGASVASLQAALEPGFQALLGRVGLHGDRLWLAWDAAHPASCWTLAGTVGLLGVATAAMVLHRRSAWRLVGAIAVFIGFGLLTRFTPENAYRWPLSLMLKTVYALPALAVAGWLLLQGVLVRLRWWGREEVGSWRRTLFAILFAVAVVGVCAIRAA